MAVRSGASRDFAALVRGVTAREGPDPYRSGIMVGPRDLSAVELERCGLAAIERRPGSGDAVTRVYCLRCGSQVSPERRETDPNGWWACRRGCNTTYHSAEPPPRGVSPDF